MADIKSQHPAGFKSEYLAGINRILQHAFGRWIARTAVRLHRNVLAVALAKNSPASPGVCGSMSAVMTPASRDGLHEIRLI
jgi:hypothetical protein